jgi:hypothetical protein
MAQAFSRLGSKVTLVEFSDKILPRDDNDVSNFMNKILLYISFLAIFSSCMSSKKMLNKGYYDMAIEKSIKKIKKESDQSILNQFDALIKKIITIMAVGWNDKMTISEYLSVFTLLSIFIIYLVFIFRIIKSLQHTGKQISGFITATLICIGLSIALL